ncbi:phosphoserine aminotransferase [Lingula anatina]|uniref:Phosphoserine aminotransferase n=1 Tax=Lingula anatina TaxID=7574 RepID=A0A1S3HKY5_LINAN|nr:phosphoserine aminotransferase [Lingula anatina]|eukprot:XP_013385669.1 phosphoserine aminotransferase [Lingula anatina]
MSVPRRVINFSPGPAKLPEKVLQQASKEMLNYDNTGLSVMEMSHRSAEFSKIMSTAEADLRDLLNIPDNYKVLFLQGGGSGQFAAIPLNLMNLKPARVADYKITGAWSSKAAKEAEKYGKVNLVLPETKKYTGIPCKSTWNFHPEASYVYYCDNETVHGVEYDHVPETNGVPLVCDMSSNFLSRPFDIKKYGVVIAGAQKNIGCAGVTVVIIREDLLGYTLPECPIIFDYKVQVGMNSLYNTPPTYSIYIMGLVLNWIKEEGGLEAMYERSLIKARAVYDLLDSSDGFYHCLVAPNARSRMNIPLRIGGPEGVPELEKKFIEETQKCGMISLKGHRSVGGIRISLYNAVTVEETLHLVEFMKEFMAVNRK